MRLYTRLYIDLRTVVKTLLGMSNNAALAGKNSLDYQVCPCERSEAIAPERNRLHHYRSIVILQVRLLRCARKDRRLAISNQQP